MMRLLRVSGLLLLGVPCLRAAGTGPFNVHISQPIADLWMYQNAPSPGSRVTASTFSYLPLAGEDDRFGQFVIKFDTLAAGIPLGLGAANYHIQNLTLTCVYASDDFLPYDPSVDPLSSLGIAPSVVDSDLGRPLELHGTGFRGSLTGGSLSESSLYGARNAFASSFDSNGNSRDVTNNVSIGVDSLPWAIGKVSAPVDLSVKPVVYLPLLPGEAMSKYGKVTFEIDLTSPSVAEYVRQGFHQGYLCFTLSSFHPVTGPASNGFPAYFTLNHPEQALFGDVAPVLDLRYSLPLNITSFTRVATDEIVFLSWNASPSFDYRVEYTGDLTGGVWGSLGPFRTATPAVLAWHGPSALPRAFFRIVRTPQ